MSTIKFRDGARGGFDRRIPHPGTFNANPLSAAAGTTALEIVASDDPHSRADTSNRALVRRLNEVMTSRGVPGCTYGFSSMFHIIVGTECPPPIDGFAWDWQGQPGHRMPQMSPDVVWALRRGMRNEGVDLMDTGGMVSTAHSEEDIHHTVEAFDSTIDQMKQEAIL